MITRFIVLALLLVGAPMQLNAQKDGHPGHRSGAFSKAHQRPVQMLLQHRERLQLTPEQVTRLQEIDQQSVERNRPYVQRLVEKHREVKATFRAQPGLTREERHAIVRRSMEEIQPFAEKLRENDRLTMTEVRTVLTREQRSLLRRVIRNGQKRDGKPGDPDRSRGRGQ